MNYFIAKIYDPADIYIFIKFRMTCNEKNTSSYQSFTLFYLFQSKW